jgi:hypothetical protein
MEELLKAILTLFQPQTMYAYKGDPKIYNQPRQIPQPIQPTQQVQQTPDQFFNFAPHIDENTKRTIYAPPQQDMSLYQQHFPQEATSAATTAFNESMYSPKAMNQNTGNPNSPYYKSWDRGYFQLNDKTVQELLQKYPNTMKKIGVNNYDDWINNKWSDKPTNFAVAKLVRTKLEDRANVPAWSQWRGWQDQGFKDVGNPNVNYSNTQ